MLGTRHTARQDHHFQIFRHRLCCHFRVASVCLYTDPVRTGNQGTAVLRIGMHGDGRHFQFGAAQHISNFLFVQVDAGVGSGAIVNDKLYRGAKGLGTEIGHTSICYNGPQCVCGNRGCLEQYATLSALKKRFGFESYETVADGALAGDPDCRQVIDFLITTLGAALVSAVNMLDPDRIVLYGEYAYRADWLTQALEDYVMTHAAICKAHPVTVIPSGQQQAHAAIGAAILQAIVCRVKELLIFKIVLCCTN